MYPDTAEEVSQLYQAYSILLYYGILYYYSDSIKVFKRNYTVNGLQGRWEGLLL